MSESDEVVLLKQILKGLEKGISESDMVDVMEEDLFDYLSILEQYYIHLGRYGEDIIVAKAKDEVDVDPELVKEILGEITTKDEEALMDYIRTRIKRLTA